jgi:hypothetical protein
MGKYKYGSIYYKNYLGRAENCQKDIIDLLVYNKGVLRYIDSWIDAFEEIKEEIENLVVSMKYQKCFNKKCAKLTHEMGILIKAQQLLYQSKLNAHQNCENIAED